MRLGVKALTTCANQRGRLQGLLRRYVHALVTQVVQSGVCNLPQYRLTLHSVVAARYQGVRSAEILVAVLAMLSDPQ